MSTVPTTLAYTVDEACSVAGIGRTALYKAIGTGELVARKYGRKTLILASDLHRFIEGLPTIEPKPIDQTKNDGLRNSRRITETSFIISANSNTH
jgi:excisionase family DNA binding protein